MKTTVVKVPDKNINRYTMYLLLFNNYWIGKLKIWIFHFDTNSFFMTIACFSNRNSKQEWKRKFNKEETFVEHICVEK